MVLTLLRHAQPEIDTTQPYALWGLSDSGRQQARRMAREPLWRDIVRIFTSPELKAHETAQIIAGPNNITVTVVEELHEVVRPTGRWLDDYPAAVAAWFAAPDEATHGWEPPAAARRRMRACIEQLHEWELEPFAVAGGGLSLSLYLASVTGADPAAIWPRITLPDLALIDTGTGALLQPFGRWQQGKQGVGGR